MRRLFAGALAVVMMVSLVLVSFPAPRVSAAPQTFVYTGAPQLYVVPDGVTSIDVTLTGAQGLSITGAGDGGEGATVTATISVNPGEVLQINVGGQGNANAASFNGGGRPGGGGATDIRRPDFSTTMTTFNSCAYNFNCALAQRIVVAGGGGGGGNQFGSDGGDGGADGVAGAAGNLTGGDATGGGGGTSSSGGAAGTGTVTAPAASAAPGAGSFGNGGGNGWATGAFGGGGGGGYYGGGQGGQSSNGTGGNIGAGGGGGGSSFTGGTGVSAGVVSTGGGTGNGSVVVSVATAIANASFGFTGAAQTYTVDSGVTELAVRLNAGAGAAQGDVVYGRLPVTEGQVLQVNIGGAATPVSQFNGTFSGGEGGWNGGGHATATSTIGAYGGGGASDIRVGSFGLTDRVVVAGGGGGCQSFWCPGNGWTPGVGGLEANGAGGFANRNTGEQAYGGGSLTSGGTWLTAVPRVPDTTPAASLGSFGVGGQGDAGGGGGYYGGAGGPAGGGGSSYATVTGPDSTNQGVGNVLGTAGAAFLHDRGGSSGDGIAVLTAMPTATSSAASNISSTGADVAGTVRPRFLASKPAVFYSTSSATVDNGGGSVQYLTGPSGATILAGDSTQNVSGSLSGLSRGTTYYFRVCARSVAGNGCSETRSFTTDPRLTYNGNSETTGTPPTSVDAVAGASVTVSANTGSLTQSGALFNGWNTQSDGLGTTYMPGAALVLASNVTLYARWTLTATVSYDGNGSTGGLTPSSCTYSVSGSACTVAANLYTRSGYTFASWNTQSNGGGTTYSPGALLTPTSDTVLYAQWTVNGGGSSGGAGSGTGTPAQIPTPSLAPGVPSIAPVVIPSTVSVRPGASVVLVGGQPSASLISTSSGITSISGSGWTLGVTPSSPGASSSLTTLPVGAGLTITGSGYLPGSSVAIYILGITGAIGSAVVGPNGTFEAQTALPAGLVGNAVLQINGVTPSLMERSASLGIGIQGAVPSSTRIFATSVYFGIFSDVLTAKARKDLRKLARQTASGRSEVVSIGFTQGVGSPLGAWTLSKSRAEKVNAFLRKHGVRGSFTARGKGNRGVKALDRTVVVTVRTRTRP